MGADGCRTDQYRRRGDLAQAAHPYSAALMADFLLGPEGAKILGDLEYGSPLKP